MDDKRKIDLQKHVVKRVSKKYLFKILLYIFLLTVITLIYVFYGAPKTEKKEVKEIEEIRNITIEE